MVPIHDTPLEFVVESTETTHTATPDATIGSILTQHVTTHDAVLVYEDGTFLGLLSPYQVLYKNRYPHTTKIKDALVIPPKLFLHTTISDAIRHMVSLRIYTLPVVSDTGEVTHIVRAKHIIQTILKDGTNRSDVAKRITVQKPITIHKSQTVKDAHALLKKENIARLLVVDETHQTIGIITRSDLALALSNPPEKQRFSKNGGTTPSQYDDEHSSHTDEPLMKYMSERVYAVQKGTPIEEALRSFIASGFSSISFLDENQHAVGFFSTRDILEAMVEKTQEDHKIVMNRPDSLTDPAWKTMQEAANRFSDKIQKRLTLDYINIDITEQKSTRGKALEYGVTIQLKGMSGGDLMASGTHKNASTALREAIDRIERQME